jgi:hypothetical protein
MTEHGATTPRTHAAGEPRQIPDEPLVPPVHGEDAGHPPEHPWHMHTSNLCTRRYLRQEGGRYSDLILTSTIDWLCAMISLVSPGGISVNTCILIRA